MGFPRVQDGVQVKIRFGGARAIIALMLREMTTTYGRSPGGYLWAVLEPVAAIAFLSLVFSAFLGSPAMGNSFAMFYATGMIPFLLFNDMHGKVAQSLMFSKQLLAYPKVTFLDAIIARFLLTLITQLLVAHLVFGGTMIFFEGWMNFDMLRVMTGLILAAFLGLGIGVLNSVIYMRFPVWQQVWSVLTRPLFLLSCAMILYEGIPQPYQDWLWWNPLIHAIGMVRTGFYTTYDGYYVSPLYALFVSMLCLSLGLVLLRRHYRNLFERN